MNALEDIRTERIKQIRLEGYTLEHDRQYVEEELVRSAVSLLLNDEELWSLKNRYYNKYIKMERYEQLKIAASLICAEMDRVRVAEFPSQYEQFESTEVYKDEDLQAEREELKKKGIHIKSGKEMLEEGKKKDAKENTVS